MTPIAAGGDVEPALGVKKAREQHVNGGTNHAPVSNMTAAARGLQPPFDGSQPDGCLWTGIRKKWAQCTEREHV